MNVPPQCQFLVARFTCTHSALTFVTMKSESESSFHECKQKQKKDIKQIPKLLCEVKKGPFDLLFDSYII